MSSLDPKNSPKTRGTTANQSKVPAMANKRTSRNAQQSTKTNARFPRG